MKAQRIPIMPDICIYHANCADGFGAAWAVWRRFGDAVRFISASYGDVPPEVEGKRILIVDFSYPADELQALASRNIHVTVLDHHKTAEAELSQLLAVPSLGIHFDMDKSGARLAWEWCCPEHENQPFPLLLAYVEDRDLWRFRLPQSREASAYISCFEKDFAVWSELAETFDLADFRREALTTGEIVLAKQRLDIEALLAVATRTTTIAGKRVPIANVPFMWASEAGNILAEGNHFAATYFDAEDGTRRVSLRSDAHGLDVSEIARSFGGGGHMHAAGFQAPAGWTGDVDHVTRYVLRQAATGSVFVKEAGFFRSQGGLTEEWGRAWVPVHANSIEHAREIGKQVADANG